MRILILKHACIQIQRMVDNLHNLIVKLSSFRTYSLPKKYLFFTHAKLNKTSLTEFCIYRDLNVFKFSIHMMYDGVFSTFLENEFCNKEMILSIKALNY